MAKREKEQRVEVTVNLADEVYAVSMFFNRFRVQRLDGHSLVDFGLVSEQGLLRQYSVVIEQPALAQSRESMLTFLGAAGEIADPPSEQWRPSSEPSTPVEVANVVHMARTGEMGEVRLGVYSSGVAVEKSRQKGSPTKVEMKAAPLALLRCDLSIQKRLLFELYGDAEV